MGILREMYKKLGQTDKHMPEIRRERAREEFRKAYHKARRHGMKLERFKGTHYYVLLGPTCYITLFPGTQGALGDGIKLDLPEEWGLIDAVDAAIAAQKGIKNER
jgi:hypothetical protein